MVKSEKSPGQRPSGQPPKSSSVGKGGSGKPSVRVPAKEYGTRPGSTKTFNEGDMPTKKAYTKPVIKGR